MADFEESPGNVSVHEASASALFYSETNKKEGRKKRKMNNSRCVWMCWAVHMSGIQMALCSTHKWKSILGMSGMKHLPSDEISSFNWKSLCHQWFFKFHTECLIGGCHANPGLITTRCGRTSVYWICCLVIRSVFHPNGAVITSQQSRKHRHGLWAAVGSGADRKQSYAAECCGK